MSLKSGDVVIRRKGSLAAVGLVDDDDVEPTSLQPMGLNDAREWARRTVAETEGEIHEQDEHGQPIS